MRIVALDFEASCLPRHGRSFPIEVGIADTDAVARSWLIRPHPTWAGWDWTVEAERLHGISYERLVAEGQPVEQVAAELAIAVGGASLFSDSYVDVCWMRTLAAAAGLPPIRVGHVEEMIARVGATDEEIREIMATADRLPVRRHRAADDARWLRGLIEGLLALAHRRCADAPHLAWGAGGAKKTTLVNCA